MFPLVLLFHLKKKVKLDMQGDEPYTHVNWKRDKLILIEINS